MNRTDHEHTKQIEANRLANKRKFEQESLFSCFKNAAQQYRQQLHKLNPFNRMG